MKISMGFICKALEKKGVNIELLSETGARFSHASVLEFAPDGEWPDDAVYICGLVDMNEPRKYPSALIVVSQTQDARAKVPGVPDAAYVSCADIFSIFYLLTNIFETYNRWETQITSIILEGGSLQDIMDCTCMVTRNPGYVTDGSLYVIAMVKDTDMEEMSAAWRFQCTHHYWPMNLTMAMINGNVLNDIKNSGTPKFYPADIFYMRYCAAAVSDGKAFYGYLYIIEVYSLLDQTDLEVMERLRDLIVYYYRHNRIAPDAGTGMFYENIFISAAKGEFQGQGESLKKELSIIGWQDDDRFQTVTLDIGLGGDADMLRGIGGIFDSELGGKVFYLDGYLNCVFSYRESRLFESRVKHYINKFSARCGVSMEFSDLQDLKYYHRQAVFALEHGKTSEKADDGDGNWCTYEALFPYHMGVTLKSALEKEDMWSSQMERLRDYDEKHNTDYVNTLYWYLQEERNVARTAKSMHTHRNTVQYRLDRIDEIIKLDLSDPAVRIRLLLEIFCIKAGEL